MVITGKSFRQIIRRIGPEKENPMKQNATDKEKREKKTPKQIAALVCVFLLAGMYLFTLVVACLDFPGAAKLFSVCLLMTIGLPILLWIYIWLYGIYKRKHNMASLDIMHSDRYTGTNLTSNDNNMVENEEHDMPAPEDTSDTL